MAVQIPRLQKLGPQAPESIGRIPTDVVQQAPATQQVDQAVTGAMSQVADYYGRVEEEAAQTTSTEASLKWDISTRTKLHQLKQIEGNPTEHYAKFDEDSVQLENDITKQYEGSSGRTQHLIKEKILKSRQGMADTRALFEGAQFSKYQDKVSTSKIVVSQDKMLDAAMFATKGQPSSLIELAKVREEIVNEHLEMAVRKGVATKDVETGKITVPDSYKPIIDRAIRTDLTKGLGDVVKTLNQSDKPEEAQYVLDVYSADILGPEKNSLRKSSDSKVVELMALKVADKVRGLDGKAAIDAIRKSTSDLVVREKAEEIFNAQAVRKKHAVERDQDQRFESALGALKGKDYTSVTELELDKDFQSHTSGLKHAQIESIKKLVFARPEFSNEKVKFEMLDLIKSGKLADLSSAQFYQKAGELSTDDFNKYERIYIQDVNETEPEKRNRRSDMFNTLNKQMILAKIIRKDSRLSTKEINTKVSWQEEMLAQEKNYPAGTKSEVYQEWVRKFVADKVAGQTFKGVGVSPKFQGGATPPQNEAPTASIYGGLAPSEKAKWQAAFIEAKKRRANTVEEMDAFYTSKGGKL